MPRDPLIGLVGKPSAGKSTTLNSLTDASSKVGPKLPIHDHRPPTSDRLPPDRLRLRAVQPLGPLQTQLRLLRRRPPFRAHRAPRRRRPRPRRPPGQGPGKQVPRRPAPRRRIDTRGGRLGHRRRRGQGDARLRPLGRHRLAARRDRGLDSGQPDGEMGLDPPPPHGHQGDGHRDAAGPVLGLRRHVQRRRARARPARHQGAARGLGRRDDRSRRQRLHGREVPDRHRAQQDRPPGRGQEHRQDRQDAAPGDHRALLGHLGDLPAQDGQAGVRQVHGGQRVRRHARGPDRAGRPGGRRPQGAGREEPEPDREPQGHGAVPVRVDGRRAGAQPGSGAAGARAHVPRAEHDDVRVRRGRVPVRLPRLRAGQEGHDGGRRRAQGHGRRAHRLHRGRRGHQGG